MKPTRDGKQARQAKQKQAEPLQVFFKKSERQFETPSLASVEVYMDLMGNVVFQIGGMTVPAPVFMLETSKLSPADILSYTFVRALGLVIHFSSTEIDETKKELEGARGTPGAGKLKQRLVHMYSAHRAKETKAAQDQISRILSHDQNLQEFVERVLDLSAVKTVMGE